MANGIVTSGTIALLSFLLRIPVDSEQAKIIMHRYIQDMANGTIIGGINML